MINFLILFSLVEPFKNFVGMREIVVAVVIVAVVEFDVVNIAVGVVDVVSAASGLRPTKFYKYSQT